MPGLCVWLCFNVSLEPESIKQASVWIIRVPGVLGEPGTGREQRRGMGRCRVLRKGKLFLQVNEVVRKGQVTGEDGSLGK